MMTLFHNENALKRGKKLKNVASFLPVYRGQHWGIDSIQHCHTENALKTGKN